METLPTLLNRKDESSWQKASASLDASAKIYGYRVDSVHSETFKFLGGLSRADFKEEAKEGDEESSHDSNSRDKKRGGDKVTVRGG
jgi:condensin complex subunit 2